MRSGASSGSVKSGNPWQSVMQTAEGLNHGLNGLPDDTDGLVSSDVPSDPVKSYNPWQSVMQTGEGCLPDRAPNGTVGWKMVYCVADGAKKSM